jgi:uncharacterized membrane protein
MTENQVNTRKIALTAVFAALYVIGSYLPGFPVIGLSESTIDPVRSLEIVYGIILGPVYGPLAAFIGAVIGKLLKGQSLFFTPLAPVSALMAALIGRKELTGAWKYAGLLLGALTFSWYLFPIGRIAWYYPLIQYIGLIVLALSRENIREYINNEDQRITTLGLILCGIPSTVAGHMLGGLIWVNLASPAPELFATIIPISMAERAMIVAVATVIGVPLLYEIKRSYPHILD